MSFFVSKLLLYKRNKTLQGVPFSENNPLQCGNHNSASSHQAITCYFPTTARHRVCYSLDVSYPCVILKSYLGCLWDLCIIISRDAETCPLSFFNFLIFIYLFIFTGLLFGCGGLLRGVHLHGRSARYRCPDHRSKTRILISSLKDVLKMFYCVSLPPGGRNENRKWIFFISQSCIILALSCDNWMLKLCWW